MKSPVVLLAIVFSLSAQAWSEKTETEIFDRAFSRLKKQPDFKNLTPPSALALRMSVRELSRLYLFNDADPFPSEKTSLATPAQGIRAALSDSTRTSMDIGLPEAVDPGGLRHYITGASPRESRWFREKTTWGWHWKRPFSTIQIPTIARLGDGAARVTAFHSEAKLRLKNGERSSLLLAGWALHPLMKLSLPLYTVQIPNVRMIPWKSLLFDHPRLFAERFYELTFQEISRKTEEFEIWFESRSSQCREEDLRSPIISQTVDDLVDEVILDSLDRNGDGFSAALMSGDQEKLLKLSCDAYWESIDATRLFIDRTFNP